MKTLRLQKSYTLVAFCLSLVQVNTAFISSPRPPQHHLHLASVEDSIAKPNLLEPATVSQRVFSTDKRPVILFDGVCNMCNSAVNLALDWDPNGRLRFAALQSDVGRALLRTNNREADDISSIVLVTENGAYVKSDAILGITEQLTPLWMLPLRPAAFAGRVLVPKLLRDLIYDGVANNRYEFMGKRDQLRCGQEEEFGDRFVDDSLALE